MGKYNTLIKGYLETYKTELGDLNTYNPERRSVEIIDEEYKLVFKISWFENPDLLEVHLTIYNTTIPVKKSNIVKKAWIYKKGDDWDIQVY